MMDANDPITTDSLKEIISLCFGIALFSKIEVVPTVINELEQVTREMRQVVSMRERGIDTNEIINTIKINLPRG